MENITSIEVERLLGKDSNNQSLEDPKGIYSLLAGLGNVPSTEVTPVPLKVVEALKEVPVETPTEEVSTVAILYNRDSLDSMAAAALFAGSLNERYTVKFVEATDLKVPKLPDCNRLIIMGVYYDLKTLEALVGEYPTIVFHYRGDQSKQVSDSLSKSHVLHVFPCEEYYGHEQMLIDNTITNVVNQYLHHTNRPSATTVVRNLVREIGLYTNLGFSSELTNEVLVKLYNLKESLEFFYSQNLPKEDLKLLKLSTEDVSYKVYQDRLRSKLSDGLEYVILTSRERGFFKLSKHYKVDLLPCPVAISRDVMRLVVPSRKSLITVEEHQGMRHYCLFTNDRRLSERLLLDLNVFKYWFEGEVLRAVAPIKV